MNSTIPWTSAYESRSVDRLLAPGEVDLAPGRLPGDGRGVLDEALGRVRPPVEEDVLDPLEQVGLDVLVDDQLTRVDDPHVEPRADRVVEEGGVHRLADGVVAAEGEGEVRDPARGERARTALLDQRQRLDERLRVAVVLLDPGRDREHVRVEDDVGRVEAFGEQQPVGPLADRDLALDLDRLALFVEGHHDRGGAEAADRPRLREERLLTLLERERVGDALSLNALQAGLDRREARAVDHDRHPRDLRLGRDHVQEGRHRLVGVEQVGVHVHVDQVRPAVDLLARDRDRARRSRPPRRAGGSAPSR